MIVRGNQCIKDINFPSEPCCSRSVLLLLNRGTLLIKNFWDIWSVSVELVYYFSQTTLGNYRLCPNRDTTYIMFSIILSAIGAHILPAIRATMGEGPSQDVVPLESLTENPEDGSPPQGLALIAHGRLGGNKDSPPVRRLADYFRQERNLRVVTWNDRGVGRSGGGNEWSDLGVWMGDAGVGDYNVSVPKADVVRS